MRRSFLLLVFLALQYSCNKEKYFAGPDAYSDGFEEFSSTDSLFLPDESHWSFLQRTRDANFITFDTTHHHSGNRSLKFFAMRSDENSVSKCSIVKQHMAFFEGDIVSMTAWYYIEGTRQADWLFIFDIEEQASIGAGPGMRIANTEQDRIAMESKFNNPTIYQSEGHEVAFPRDQWVKLEVEMKLSQKKKGYVRVWQDGTLLLSKDNCKTLPKDFLYAQQGTKGMYTSIEFGITANSKNNDMVLYLDDLSVRVK